MRKYSLVMQYSEEDKAFVVTVPALPGCMTHGATAAQALKMAEEAIEAYIGDDPAPPEDVDRTFSGRVLLRLPAMLHRSLNRAATKEDTSLNQYIVNLLAMAQGARSALELATSVRDLDGGARQAVRKKRAAGSGA